MNDRYRLELERLHKVTSCHSGIKAWNFELRAVPKGEVYKGAIALERMSNGRWAGAKWISYATRIAEKEGIEQLGDLKKLIEEVRATHHLQLKKKYEYLVKKNDSGIPF